MAKRIYNPLDPTASEEDPLGPAAPGAPRNTAPSVARSALLDGLAPAQGGQRASSVGAPTIDSSPTEGVLPPGGTGPYYPTIESSPTEGVPPPGPIAPYRPPSPGTDPYGTIDSSPTEGVPPGPIPPGHPAPPAEPAPSPTDTPQPFPGPRLPPWSEVPPVLPTGPIAPQPTPPLGTDVSAASPAAPTLSPGAPTSKTLAGPMTSAESPGDPNAPPPDVPPSPTAPPAPTTSPTTPPAQPHVVEGGTPEGITALYAKYKLHPPSADEIEKWLNGTYGGGRTMAEVEAQIAASDEAKHAQGGTGGRTDPNYVNSVVAQWMATNNPRGHQDAAYWTRRILETGGLGPDNMAYWQGRFTEAEGTHPAEGGGGGAPAGGPGAPSVPSPGGTGASVPTSAYNQKLRDMMLAQLNGLTGSIDENNPELSPAISAYNTQSQRDQQTERDQLAERAYARGDLNSGGFDTQITQGREAAAGKRANFSGSMVYQANVQRRQQLQAMMQTAVSAGLTDRAQAIQTRIADIDAELRRMGMNLQNSQFGDSLGYQYAALIAQMNRDSLLSGMHG